MVRASRISSFIALLAAAILAQTMADSASARDIFVNNEVGNDVNNGQSATNRAGIGPVRTIQRALRIARAGDRVILARTPTAYRESISVQNGANSGFPLGPFVIEGNGAVLDGTRSIPHSAWEHVAGDVFRFRPPRFVHQLLYLDNKPASRTILKSDDDPVKLLKPLHWCYTARHIHFKTDAGNLPQAYQLSHTYLRVGITVYETRYVLIKNLIVQGFQLDGINAHDKAVNTRLVGLTCRGNGRSGISIGGASRVSIESCLIGNNGGAQVRTEGRSKTQIVNCDLIDDGHTPTIDRTGGQVVVQKPAK